MFPSSGPVQLTAQGPPSLSQSHLDYYAVTPPGPACPGHWGWSTCVVAAAGDVSLTMKSLRTFDFLFSEHVAMEQYMLIGCPWGLMATLTIMQSSHLGLVWNKCSTSPEFADLLRVHYLQSVWISFGCELISKIHSPHLMWPYAYKSVVCCMKEINWTSQLLNMLLQVGR